MDLRPWQPQPIFVFGQLHAIGSVGGLLDEKAQPELPRNRVVKLLYQVPAKQHLPVRIVAALIEAVDEVYGRGKRIERWERGFIADVNPERPAAGAKATIARSVNAGRDERPP